MRRGGKRHAGAPHEIILLRGMSTGGAPTGTTGNPPRSTPARTAAGTATGPIATATNTADAPMAKQSDAQNLTVEDARWVDTDL